MEPNAREVEMSRVLTLIDEMRGKRFDKDNYSGYHPDAYCQTNTQEELNEKTAYLCNWLTEIEMLGKGVDN